MKKIRYVAISILWVSIAANWLSPMWSEAAGQQTVSFSKELDTLEGYDSSLTEGRKKFDEYRNRFSDNSGLQEVSRRIETARIIKERILAAVAQMIQDNTISDIHALLGDEDVRVSVLQKRNASILLTVPPERLFDKYVEQFTAPIDFSGLPEYSVAAAQHFYGLQLKVYAKDIINHVRTALVIDPSRLELYGYGVVIPALAQYSVHEDVILHIINFMKEVNTAIHFSNFSLRRLECPEFAFKVAKKLFEPEQREASLKAWVIKTSQSCVEDRRPDIAEGLLRAAIHDLTDEDKVIELRLKIAESYGNCDNNIRAIKECRRITKDFPDSPLCGKAMSSYFAYLAKESKAQEILAEIDPALKMPQCQKYLPQLMYLKWWALRKTNQQIAAEQIGKDLIENYGDNTSIAPVLLAHASNALSNQRYGQCRKLLQQLTRNFPQTNSADQARKILSRLDKK